MVIFEIFDRDRNFSRFLRQFSISVQIFENLTEIEIFEIVDRNQCFSKILTEIENFFSKIFRFLTEIDVFRKFWPKSRFSKFFTAIDIFRKFWTKSRFSKILTQIKNFEIFDRNGNFWQKSKFFTISIFFSKNLTEIEIFEIVDRNRCFSKILTEIEMFKICDQDQCFPKNIDWNRNFRNFRPKSKIVSKKRFPKFLTEI